MPTTKINKHTDGTLISILSINENTNKFNGKCIWFFDNGQINFKRNFKNDVIIGLAEDFNFDSSLASVRFFF